MTDNFLQDAYDNKGTCIGKKLCGVLTTVNGQIILIGDNGNTYTLGVDSDGNLTTTPVNINQD